MNRSNSGFTLVELMVALGLAVVIIVAMAQVFGISTTIVRASFTQADFYSKLGAAHAIIADEFSTHDPTAIQDIEQAYQSKWTVTEPNERGASSLILAGSADNEGVLFAPVRTNNGFARVLLPSVAFDPSSHVVLTTTTEVFYETSPDFVVLEGPDATVVHPVVFYFASNQHE